MKEASTKRITKNTITLTLRMFITMGISIYSSRIILQALAYIIHSGFISGYQNRYGDNLKPPTNVYHRMTA